MVHTGMQGTTVKELTHAFEAGMHTKGSSKGAQSIAELRTQQAEQVCLLQTFTLVAKVALHLASRVNVWSRHTCSACWVLNSALD